MTVALVTGASSGIGAAIAVAFAEAGWDVMAAGRDAARLDAVAETVDDIAVWAGPLNNSEDCDELVADTVDEFGRIDCLVNCAGVLLLGSADETDDEDWRTTFSINLDVPFYLSRAALPYLIESGGNIVNIASDWGLRAGERAVAYCASKGGLILLTRAMARDHAAEGIRVNAVCPGDVDTPMLAQMADDFDGGLEEYLESLANESPSGRIAIPEDVASLVLFLASDGATHINGAAIPVDGGSNA